MKLHDLRPPEGSRTARTRVGRGIAAGKGKTAGRGTKGQKARAGGSIPPWFEGGQTPLHMRIPKLRGFRNRFKVDYEIVNVGDIARVIESGRLSGGEAGARGKPKAPITVNQDLLKDAGLIRTLDKPMKVLGNGELSVALFVVADAFTKSAREKIEAAGGSVNVLEVPTRKRPALGVDSATEPAAVEDEPAPTETEPETPAKSRRGKASAAVEAESAETEAGEFASEPVESALADATEPDPVEAEASPAVADEPDESTTSPSDEA
jgi:large subunit ribosomal protein L15